MKRIYLIACLLTALCFVSCDDQFKTHLDEIQVSQSYVGLPANGGSVSVTVTATDSWNFQNVPEWLTITPSSGSAGETVVKFTAGAATSSLDAVVQLHCNGAMQRINVIQMTEKMELPISTCAQIIAGDDGVVYRAKGVVTGIANTQYGNWYLDDGTGTIYIYGTLDANGGTKNFLSLGIEVGDVVTVEGPRTNYNGTIELVDVTVIEIEKSLIKVVSDPVELDIEGGAFDVELECKGNGIAVEIPADAQDWLQVIGISQRGTVALVSFLAAPNLAGDRATTLTFTTNDGEYSSVLSVSQVGSIIDATAAEINAAADGTTQYRITGYVANIVNTQYGNMYLSDATGQVYVYGTLDAEGNTKNFSSLGINIGDIVTVVGPKSSYNGAAQMVNVTVVDHIPVQDVTVEEFLAAPVGDTYYRLTGIAGPFNDGDLYGNFDIEDATGSVYVYGLLSGFGGPKKLFQELLANTGLKPGDVLTLVGTRADYKGTAQVGNAFYVSHREADPPALELEGEGTLESPYTVADALALYADGQKPTDVYFKGVITNIKSVSVDYGNAEYTISNSIDADNALLVYRGYYLEGEKFTAEDQIAVGDAVVLFGSLSEYNGVAQIGTGSKLVSIN